MSGQRATDHDSRRCGCADVVAAGPGASPSSPRSVARRVRGGRPGIRRSRRHGADDGRRSKAAAAAPTSTRRRADAAPPDDLGDDPELDALAQSCFDGDLVACDHLFLQSPIDSDYEDVRRHVRRPPGRRAPVGYCGLEPRSAATASGEPVPPEGLGADPALDALAQSCYVGDMEACDELYGSAESGSAYQVYGDTCAGRQPENTGSFCTALEDPVPGTGVVPTTDATPTTVVDVDDRRQSRRRRRWSTSRRRRRADRARACRSSPATIPAPTLEPTGLGDDPTLDALAQSCYDGDLAACDDLYRDADPGTPYRNYGDTCAGRQDDGLGDLVRRRLRLAGSSPPSSEPQITDDRTDDDRRRPSSTVADLAADDVTTSPPSTPTTAGADRRRHDDRRLDVPASVPPPTLEPTGLGTDPALDALAQSCYDGDLAACDDLWRDSEPDSAYRNFADTCAGRQPAEHRDLVRRCVRRGRSDRPTDRPAPRPGRRPSPATTVPAGVPDRRPSSPPVSATTRPSICSPNRASTATCRRATTCSTALRSDRTTGRTATRVPAARSRARSTTAAWSSPPTRRADPSAGTDGCCGDRSVPYTPIGRHVGPYSATSGRQHHRVPHPRRRRRAVRLQPGAGRDRRHRHGTVAVGHRRPRSEPGARRVRRSDGAVHRRRCSWSAKPSTPPA